jgi:hypothetical protein
MLSSGTPGSIPKSSKNSVSIHNMATTGPSDGDRRIRRQIHNVPSPCDLDEEDEDFVNPDDRLGFMAMGRSPAVPH